MQIVYWLPLVIYYILLAIKEKYIFCKVPSVINRHLWFREFMDDELLLPSTPTTVEAGKSNHRRLGIVL